MTKTHCKRHTPEYNSWAHIKQRCINKNNKSYADYGARGIIICDRWLNSFENFLSDMGLRPTNNHSIDRKDNNGNYEPSNCRWATRDTQNNNARSNIRINGKTFLDISIAIGVPVATLRDRHRRGWSDNEVEGISKHVRPIAKRNKNGSFAKEEVK